MLALIVRFRLSDGLFSEKMEFAGAGKRYFCYWELKLAQNCLVSLNFARFGRIFCC